ncbi:hypothetical protein LB557_02020 [Mesorhizobium sp. BR115XR7A]|uniref:hypothetical protein n=1 Tax=Mesorhizobium sp. BR115XR7A TaxID=2876645 RepID=UPI001CCE0E45|nr:hypothetical protein [Mesorhizobium sp. BR115XR7A]MBZ9904784.1 hypothetical protein [Mesorhizobium sp. BR115XR7A]MBZ9933033.1 hypothetical protein [Mesorhizobium sp. BR1-1-5]
MTEKSSGQSTITTVTIDVAQKSATTAHYQGKLTGASSAGGGAAATGGNSGASGGGNSTAAGGKKE